MLTACVHDNKSPIVKEHTQRPENLFAEATRLYGERRIMAAIEKLKQADKIAPNNPNTIANLASYLFEAKLYEQSTKYYERLIQLEPNNSHVKTVYNSSILSSLFGKRKCKEADSFIKKLKANKPDNAFIHWNLASCYQHIQDYKKALEYWQEMVKIEPKNMRAMSKIIQVYQATMSIEKRDNAIADILKAYKNKVDLKYVKDNLFCREHYKDGEWYVYALQYFDPEKNGYFYQPLDAKNGNQHFYRFSALNLNTKENFWLSLGSYQDATESARLRKEISQNERIYHINYYDDENSFLYGVFNNKPSYDDLREIMQKIIVSRIKYFNKKH